MSTSRLPDLFSDLEPLVEHWCLPTEQARYLKLHSVNIEDLRAFYQQMLPRMEAVLQYLNQFKVSDLPPAERCLFDLAMTFAETAHPIDLGWQDVDFNEAYPWQAFEFRTVSCQPAH